MATASASQPPTTIPNWSARIPALDGLRGVAILLVLLRHAVFGVSSVQGIETHSRSTFLFLATGQLTWSGVDLFFVLSGFLIGGILLDVRSSPRYFQTFYLRRAYRILPLYFLVIGLSLLPHLARGVLCRAGRAHFAAANAVVGLCPVCTKFLDGASGHLRTKRHRNHLVTGD